MDKSVNPVPAAKSTSALELGRERVLTQYAKGGNMFQPVGHTESKLPAGAYSIGTDMQGKAFFERMSIKSDELLPLNNSIMKDLESEYKKFWTPEARKKSENMGFTHKRGFLFHGAPGTGKSCFAKIIMENAVKDDSIVFVAKSPYALPEVLKQFKEVEADRPVFVVLEDMDELIQRGEHALLELMDGPNAVGGVFYMGTTNYLDRIPERMRRKSRFDRVVEIGPPDAADRYAYFKAKLGTNESEARIKQYVEATDGKVYSDMKDLVYSIYCLDIPAEKAIREMRGGNMNTMGRAWEEVEFNEAVKKAVAPKLESINENETTMVDDAEWEEVPEIKAPISRAGAILKQMEAVDDMPTSVLGANGSPDPAMVKASLEKRLVVLGITDVEIGDIVVDTEGNVAVDFISNEGDLLTIVFSYDDDEGCCALVHDGSLDDDDAYALVIELDAMNPSIIKTNFGTYMNMADLSWLSKNAMLTILDAGNYDVSKSAEPAKQQYGYDAFGNLLQQPEATGESLDHELIKFSELKDDKGILDEAFKVVIRGGKRERLPIVRRKRKKRLTPRQRAGLRKASRTRRSSSSKLKRKRSLQLRKRMHLKPQARRAGYRVGG